MIGKVIGNYQITGELAQGGMGAVYRGHHLRLPREVVVKSILLDSFSPSAQAQLKARFCREACIQSQLDHPNIVRVFEFFETEENYFLVMEYVSGVSLRDLLDRQGVASPSQAVYLFKQVLSALDYAHNFTYVDESNHRHKGIIHRDINPANLLLDHRGRIKITDFGAVKLTGESKLTQSGFHPGTVEYMSPEQLRGVEIDARSDIYSIGVTFYETLTGQVPFPRSPGGSDWEVRKGHIELEPPSIQKVRPEVTSQLATIVMRALQKDPKARYGSAAEFLAALRDHKQQHVKGKQKSRNKFAVPAEMPTIAQTENEPDEVESTTSSHPFEEALTAMTIPISLNEPSISYATTASQSSVSNPLNPMTTSGVAVSMTKPILSKREWGLTAATVALFLAAILLGAYLFLRQSEEHGMQAAMTKVEARSPEGEKSPAATDGVADIKAPTPQPAINSPALNRAREFEKQERYDRAILAYEAYLWRNQNTTDADLVVARISELKRFQQLMKEAKTAARRNKLSVARQNYNEALQINPDSQNAEEALAKIERRIAPSAPDRRSNR
ncbi:MAG: protein kinase domain-containing protein [Blastocatellia bacterium]